MLRALLPVCCCCSHQWLCWRWYGAIGGMGGMSPAVAVLVPWDVAIYVVTIVHQNADISMSGLGVNCSSAVGDCAILPLAVPASDSD